MTTTRAISRAGVLIGALALAVPSAVASAQESSAQVQDSTREDSTKWGYTTDRDPAVQNPPGYRGMERPVNVFPPDSAAGDSAAPASATSRTSQMQRQDSLGGTSQQNPPGYRGMERPVRPDSAETVTTEGMRDSAPGQTNQPCAGASGDPRMSREDSTDARDR